MTAAIVDKTNLPARMSEARTSLIAALLVAIGPVSMALYTPAMPEIVTAFQTSPAMVKTTLAAYFGGFAFAQLVAGPVSDAFGRRSATMAFMGFYLVGSLVAAFAPTVEILTFARLVQGIGAAVGVTVARAIVRDQFIGEKAARIMNMVGIILAIAPAVSPALGGSMLILFGWQAIFVMMLMVGLIVCAVVHHAMAETIVPSAELARPSLVLRAYRTVLANGQFMSASITVGFAIGIIYTLATILPFVLIDRVGMTPMQFAFGMLLQSGFFLLGSISARVALSTFGAARIVLPGLLLMAVGSALLILLALSHGPSFLAVMGPVALIAFGIAFVMPEMTVAGLRPFSKIAGSASAMMGFIQMGAGLSCGIVAALLSDAVVALITIIPAMCGISAAGYIAYRVNCRDGEKVPQSFIP